MKQFYTLAILLNIYSFSQASQQKQSPRLLHQILINQFEWKPINEVSVYSMQSEDVELKKASIEWLYNEQHKEEIQSVLHDVDHLSTGMDSQLPFPCTTSGDDKDLDKIHHADPKSTEYALLMQKIYALLKTKEIINKEVKTD